jgi:Putative auto-transporter adhesin, head GIN domain
MAYRGLNAMRKLTHPSIKLGFLAAYLSFMTFSMGTWAEDIVSKTVALDGVTQIILKGGTKLHVTQGDKEFVKVTAAKSALPRIEATVKGTSLTLGTRQQFWQMFDFGSEIRFEVQLKSPESIQSHGAANISADQLDLDQFSVQAKGSGDIHLATVEAERIEMTLSGSGNLRTDTLKADTLILWASGSGNAELADAKTHRFDIRLGGSGDLKTGAVKAQVTTFEFSGSGNSDMTSIKANKIDIDRSGSGNFHAGDMKGSTIKLEIAGSGGVRVKQIKTDQLSLEMMGSGDGHFGSINSEHMTGEISGSGSVLIAGKGKVGELYLDVNGSGDFRAKKMQCDNAEVSVSSSSDALVNVKDYLKAKTSGSASIQYYGNPKVDSQTNGSGSISAIN